MCCSDNFTEADLQKRDANPVYLDTVKGMQFFDPHVHMTSRTTDDYQAMADAGVVALIEPAFWLGQPRTGIATFRLGAVQVVAVWYQALLHDRAEQPGGEQRSFG